MRWKPRRSTTAPPPCSPTSPGRDAAFRPHQLEAVRDLVEDRARPVCPAHQRPEGGRRDERAGHGLPKPYLGFVVHYQAPDSVISH
jgi:hypothetical protein